MAQPSIDFEAEGLPAGLEGEPHAARLARLRHLQAEGVSQQKMTACPMRAR